MTHVSPLTQQCIDACTACAQSCSEAVRHCLEMGERHAGVKHLTLLIDCADICAAAAAFMARGSEHQACVCAECADVCDGCADSCNSFEDPFMKACADACIDCAAACREMAQQDTGTAKRAEAEA